MKRLMQRALKVIVCGCLACVITPAIAFAEDAGTLDGSSLLMASYCFVTSDGDELSYTVKSSANESLAAIGSALGKSAAEDITVVAPRGTKSIWLEVSTYFDGYIPTKYGEDGDNENQITITYVTNGTDALKNALLNDDASRLLQSYYSNHEKEWTPNDRYVSFPDPADYSKERIAFQLQTAMEESSKSIGAGLFSNRSNSKLDLIGVYLTYAEDKDAADKIAALPEATDVTLESAEAIAAARAAYDLLAQWDGAQDAIDATKLTAAEAKLAELQKDAALTELGEAIAEAEKVDTSKLTDEQKKALQDAIDAAKTAQANDELDADAIADAKGAIVAATSTAQGQVAEAVKAAEEAAKAKAELKANPMTVTAKTVKAKAKKKTTIKKNKAFKVNNAQGAVTFMKKSGNKKIQVSKSGKITVKKGLKKGKTYKVKVQVSAAGNAQYKPATATVTLKVKVK